MAKQLTGVSDWKLFGFNYSMIKLKFDQNWRINGQIIDRSVWLKVVWYLPNLTQIVNQELLTKLLSSQIETKFRIETESNE